MQAITAHYIRNSLRVQQTSVDFVRLLLSLQNDADAASGNYAYFSGELSGDIPNMLIVFLSQ